MRGLSTDRLDEYGVKLKSFAKVTLITLLIAAAFSVFSAPADAQTLTYTLKTSSADGKSVTPELTWSTAPAGAICTAVAVPAAAKWSGPLNSSGTKLVDPITATNSFSIGCNWAGSLTAHVIWTAPTTNTDGSAYTNPGGYRIVYGTSADNLDRTIYLQDPAVRAWDSPTLTAGNWYFGVIAFNALGLEGAVSTIASKTLTVGVSQNRTIEVVVKFPGQPTGVAAE